MSKTVWTPIPSGNSKQVRFTADTAQVTADITKITADATIITSGQLTVWTVENLFDLTGTALVSPFARQNA
jgi:hypothetical protein